MFSNIGERFSHTWSSLQFPTSSNRFTIFSFNNPTAKIYEPSASINNESGEVTPPNNLDNKINQNEKIDNEDEDGSKFKYKPQIFDAWSMIITTVLVGQYFGWNVGIYAGCGSYIISQILIGLAYVNLAFCLAEIISTTSFSGGAYGMARVVMGFYVGFIVASFELMEYMTYISFAVAYLANFFITKFSWSNDQFPVVCFIMYIILSVLLIDQNHFFWRFNYFLALCTFVILLIYCFGSLSFVDFQTNAPLKFAPTDDYDGGYYDYITYTNTTLTDTGNNNSTLVDPTSTFFNPHNQNAWFNGGMVAFLQTLPYATWGFAGVESAALITDMIENPRIKLSYGIAAAVVTLFVMMMFTMFVAMSLPPGANNLYLATYLMNEGFGKMGINETTAEWLTVPGQIAMAFGFTIPSYKLLQAIAHSSLIPPALGLKQSTANNNHMLAVLIVLIISYLLCLLAYYVPEINLSNIATLFACFTYLSDLYAYYKMKTDFFSRDSHFINPFGVVGAIFATLMFSLTIISLIFYQSDYITIYGVLVCVGLLSIYYYTYAKQHQQFSEDESKILLVLHVMKKNQRAKLKTNKQQKKWWPMMMTMMGQHARIYVSSPPASSLFSGGGGGGGGSSANKHESAASHT